MFSLALVGRPNVGKSTLFNRFAGKKLAIVDNTPGVTRDWREAEGWLFDQHLRIIDTAGLEENFDDSIEGRMRQQTEAALNEADAILFMVDGRSGVTPLDEHFAAFLRRQNKPVVLVVNKCENQSAADAGIAEAYGLGLGEPYAISAEHNVGMDEIYNALKPHIPVELTGDYEGDEDDLELNEEALDALEGNIEFEIAEEEIDPDKPLKIAIVGRPNVGKSTLLNAIVDEQRVMTGPEAGITRDAIAVDWEYESKHYGTRKFKLVDTAGMRRKSHVVNKIEKMSVEDAMRAIRLAQVVIMVIDANNPLEKQDLQIAEHVINEGRAIVIAVNKWDSIEGREDKLEDIKWLMENSLAQIKDLPYQTISAMNGKNINKLLDRALETYEYWNKRIPTAGLNQWLGMMETRNPAPLIGGRSNRLKYITQIKTRPPTFALWMSRPEKLADSYRRFIVNGLRKDYKIPGVPIRLLIRKSKNPFAD